METIPKQPGKLPKNMGLLGMGLCVLCCALPVVGIIGGGGLLATLALYAEKVAIVLFILSASLFVFWLYRKRQAPRSCSVDCSCKAEHAEFKNVSNINVK